MDSTWSQLVSWTHLTNNRENCEEMRSKGDSEMVDKAVDDDDTNNFQIFFFTAT